MDRTGQKPGKNEKFRTSSDQDQLLLKSSDQNGPGPKIWNLGPDQDQQKLENIGPIPTERPVDT